MIKCMSRAWQPSESLFPQSATMGPEKPPPGADAKIKSGNVFNLASFLRVR